jgi:cathepsin X
MGAAECKAIIDYPHATVSEYGVVGEGMTDLAKRAMMIKKEVYTRGPVACGIQATPLKNFMGGEIFSDKNASIMHNHVVSIVGFGHDKDTKKDYWIVRNSWGQYWAGKCFIQVQVQVLKIIIIIISFRSHSFCLSSSSSAFRNGFLPYRNGLEFVGY